MGTFGPILGAGEQNIGGHGPTPSLPDSIGAGLETCNQSCEGGWEGRVGTQPEDPRSD